ncbi:MAG: hydroxylamine oxidase [Syntrophobacteraceae bacterium]|nr:hydroxylamine oxidase [Syntrophobacteraceae bacterium]
MKTAFAFVIFVFAVLAILSDARGEPSVSGSTEECIGCHVSTHPGIVEGWKRSRHAATTPAEAMKVSGRARKISSGDVPEDLKNVAVGCAECHLMRPRAHTDTFEHNGYDVHVVVSPQDCAVCHVVETEQYGRNLMAHAYGNLVNNDVYRMLISAVNDTPVMDKGRLAIQPSNAATDAESCLYCHGTRLEVTGKQTRETTVGEMEFPVIAGWPNGGVGRVNLDGSVGSCSACHTRHEFSISMARKPYTCKECHVGPDVPAYKVYAASKHGNIYSAKYQDWNFKNVPWTAGKDFTAPTCAVCHISEVVGLDGEIVSKRTHEVKDRLPWRIFGLIYAHPHPRDADTSVIRNQQGLPLPTDFGGGIAEKYLMNEQERAEAQKAMQATCFACHDGSWVDGHWERFVNTIEQTNAAALTGTHIMGEIWKRGLAVNHEKGGNPFDEYIERVWSDMWLFYGNSVRFASAMGGGGDYAVFADGRYQMTKAIRELDDWLALRKKLPK